MSSEDVAKYKLPPNRKFKSKTAHVFPSGFASSQSRINDKFCLDAVALSSQIIPHTSSVIEFMKGHPSLSTFTIGNTGQDDDDNHPTQYEDGTDPFADVAGCYMDIKKSQIATKGAQAGTRKSSNHALSSNLVKLHPKNPKTLHKQYPDMEKVYVIDNAESEVQVVPQAWFKKTFDTMRFEDWFVETQINPPNSSSHPTTFLRKTASTTALQTSHTLAASSSLNMRNSRSVSALKQKWPPKIPDLVLPTPLPRHFMVHLYKYQAIVKANDSIQKHEEIKFETNAPFSSLTLIIGNHLGKSAEYAGDTIIKYFHPVFHSWRD